MEDGPKNFKQNKQEEEKIHEKVKELRDFCEENGNHLTIVDYGENFDLEKIKVKNEAFEGLKEEEKKWIFVSIEAFVSYLNGLTFTDEFSENHSARREWESKMYDLMKQKNILKQYGSNKLGVNNWVKVTNFLNVLLDVLKNEDLVKKLMDIKKEMKSFFNMDTNYNKLKDEEKIIFTKQISEIDKKILALMTE